MHERPTPPSESVKPTPTVSAVLANGTFVELTFNPADRTTALAVFRTNAWTLEASLQVENGERLVPFSPRNNLIKNGAVLLPSEPEEYGTEGKLLDEIGGFIHRYVDVSPTFEKVASCYVLLTWLYDAFNEMPYLRFRGDFGTGKTRALTIIGAICYKPFFASGASTVSPLFHTLDAFRGTLVIDEADFRFSDEKAEIVKILNNGNVKGLPVLRTMQTDQREFNPRAFQVFGPKIVGARGSFNDRALESRFLTEEMGQRPLRRDIPINLPGAYEAEALTLRNKLLLYRFRNWPSARIDPRLVDLALEPRLNQILVPLLSVIDRLELRSELKAVAAECQASLVSERRCTPEADVLEAIRSLADESGGSGIAIGDIATRFAELHGVHYERPITARWTGNLIRRRLRLATYKSHGVYVIPFSERPRLEMLWKKYGIETAPADIQEQAEPSGRYGDMGTSTPTLN